MSWSLDIPLLRLPAQSPKKTGALFKATNVAPGPQTKGPSCTFFLPQRDLQNRASNAKNPFVGSHLGTHDEALVGRSFT